MKVLRNTRSRSWSWSVTGGICACVVSLATLGQADCCDSWRIDSNTDWARAEGESSHLSMEKGRATPTARRAHFKSITKTFPAKRKAKAIRFKQAPVWDNWEKVANVGPEGTANAPVFLPVSEGDYWYFAEDRENRGGYTAWHSSDMETWEKHGQVTESRWMTTAEYADGKYYLYYDEPNDEDPHLVIYDDLREGEGKDVGEVFADPSHGSDAGILRSAEGAFHLIYEDWSPINARQHSWDSPLAGHAESEDGIHGFEPHEHAAPIDERTVPLPEFGSYNHPATSEHRFHKHKGPQNAYGDYTLIQVGERYYIFCDFDPHGRPMRIGYWVNDSLYTQFDWGGEIGEGFHPDPTIGFADGRFYLIAQRSSYDYVSRGPWVERVQARVGVDREGDGAIDQWTEWQEVRERYSRKPEFARVVEADPARLDLASLPSGHGFKFQVKLEDGTENAAKPILDEVRLSFE